MSEITDKERLDEMELGLQVVCHQEKVDGEWETQCHCNYGFTEQATGSSIREVIDNAIKAKEANKWKT